MRRNVIGEQRFELLYISINMFAVKYGERALYNSNFVKRDAITFFI